MGVIERAYKGADGEGGWPPYLYKYRPLRSSADLEAIKWILDGNIYAAQRSQFNDPFDCAPVLEVAGTPQEIDQHFRHVIKVNDPSRSRAQRRGMLQQARRNVRKTGVDAIARLTLDQTLDSSGIVCLTVKPDDLLMWGHYASEHSGVCLRFCLKDPGADFRCAFPIGYADERPILKYPIDDAAKLMEAAFLTKAKCWEYEQEWRIIQQDGPGEQTFRPESLDGVIFGARSNADHVCDIIDHIRTKPRQNMSLFRAELDEREYKIRLMLLQNS